MRHLLASLVLIAACATAPDEQQHTIYVGFDHVPTASDVSELEALGASIQHRLELARALTLRSGLAASAFSSAAGVVATHDLGKDEDPMVSVFIKTDGPPTEADEQLVRDAGARSAYALGDPLNIVAATIRLSLVPSLDGISRFVSIEVDLETSRIE